nr:copia protein [Tanacetum cinerariifolium]
MTIQSSIKDKILVAQNKASEAINAPTEMLRGLDDQMEHSSNGALYYLDQIWVLLTGEVRTLIMDEAHKSKHSIHPGADNMYYDLGDMYWRPRMKKDIALYVRKCLACSKIKLMQEALRTYLDISTTYHPQIDGQSERTIQTLKDMIMACMMNFRGSLLFRSGTQDTNIIAGIQDDDSESECDEQAILVTSFPSNSFLGPKVNDVSAPMENNLDYAEELARLQKQEHEAHSAAATYGFEFSNETAEMLHQAEIATHRNLVLATGNLAGSSVSIGGVPAGSVPARSVPTSNVPAGGVLAGSIDSASFGDPAASDSVPAVFNLDYAADSTLPPGHSLGLSEHSTRFPSPSDLGNHQPTAGIFSSSSYDDDFCADVTNVASSVAVDPVATKRVNTIHPQSQIIGELQKNAIGTKWILKNKRDARGIMVRNKARLVAQGHRQEEDIDYDKFFAPVARIEAIRLFLAFASYMGFMVYQMDVKSAFLYGEIKEEVYVTQPKGFKDPYNPKHVYKVVKALYGLH